MKLGYRIGLFLFLALIIIVIVLLMWKRQSLGNTQLLDEQQNLEENMTESQEEIEIGVSQAQNIIETTTCNTICIYENLDRKNNTITLEEGKLPGKYIDMNREQLEKALREDSLTLTLEEKEKGFCSQSLVSFSSEEIKIVRIYDSTEEDRGFYLMAVDHCVWVYKPDRSTLYFKTDLVLEELPEKLQVEIVNGKYMENEEAIYSFLESYSS